MEKGIGMPIDFNKVQTPAYICEERLLEKNLQVLHSIKKATGVKIVLALKGYALWSTFDLVGRYLDGCTASGLHEAKLAREVMNKEVHTYSPAFSPKDIEEVAKLSNDVVFNSPLQLKTYSKSVKKINKACTIGLRINPECSFSPVDQYDPCALYSRLGTTKSNFDENLLDQIDGLHFHALCEQNVDALEQVLKIFETNFSRYFSHIHYVNFGGGHHITRKDYDVEGLITLLKGFKNRHPHLELYLEPGEAVGWKTGVLVATVLDIVHNGMDIAILDVSAEAHMPDSLSMPYRVEVRGASKAGVKKYTYKLGGNTCLAGDVMGDYSFDAPLVIGDKIIFEDQIHYTFVKSTTFNGVALPSLMLQTKEGELKCIKKFSYEDYKQRLS